MNATPERLGKQFFWKCFTWIELLIVIAVIAIPAILELPALKGEVPAPSIRIPCFTVTGLTADAAPRIRQSGYLPIDQFKR